ncbi:Ubiquitin carboxyl-terminal hydrolase 10 [Fukomys damarensis]|uniref:Ubiquitin carboxyl-terminal hydrolase 10 n=1 Tax=Fukomys damarensis TaxID=885580 RepID=A0A091DT59_FUKDA|nr:Ubiquitin carboxyl-terminal hydrolase 10 [Fukomys damarensis]
MKSQALYCSPDQDCDLNEFSYEKKERNWRVTMVSAGAEAEALKNAGGPSGLELRVQKRKKKWLPRYYQNSTDFISDTVPDGHFHGGLDSMARTVEQPEGCHWPDLEQTHLPEEFLLWTAVAPPCVATDTTENLGVTTGQVLESWSVESTDLSKLELKSPPIKSGFSIHIPIDQPASSWASLFHDAKPSSSSHMVCVETECSPIAASLLASEKQVEVKEGLVLVSEDPVAIQITELLKNVTLIHKSVSALWADRKGNWCYINATLQALAT